MGFKPLHDWVLIKRGIPEEKTSGGIIIPDAAKSKPAEGVIEAIGPGRYKQEKDKNGKDKQEKKFVSTVLKPGQQVMFIDYMAKDITLDGQEITLIREEDILGTIEPSNALTTKKPYHVEVKKDRPPMVQDKPGKAEVKEKSKEPAQGATKKEEKTKAAKKTKAKE